MQARRDVGFTLIELLVVMAIIALLSSVVLATLSTARVKARDANRIANVHQITLALEQYDAAFGTYAVAGAGKSANPGSGYLNVSSSSPLGTGYSNSLASSLYQNQYLGAAKIRDSVFGDQQYYLGVCTSTSAYTLYLQMEQPQYRQPTSTIAAGCDGASALAANMNYIAGSGGGGGVATGGGGGGGGPANLAWNGYMYWPGIPTASGGQVGSVTTLPAYIDAGSYGSVFDGTNMWVTDYNGTIYKTPIAGGASSTCAVGGIEGMTYDGANVWTINNEQKKLSKITPPCSVQTWSLSDSPYGIAFDGTNIWTTTMTSGTLSKYSTAGTLLGSYSYPQQPRGIAYDGTSLWVANNTSIAKVTATGTITAFTVTGAVSIQGLASDGTNLWLADDAFGVFKVSRAGAVLASYPMSSGPTGIAFDGTNMWTANANDGTVSRITPTGGITSYSLADASASLHGITFDGTYMWVAGWGTQSIFKVLAR